MKTVTYNKKVNFDYEVLETFEAGIVLEGNEVKSIRNGKISIKEAFVSIKSGEVFLIQCHIARYDKANTFKEIDETRTRKLLLHKKEINKLKKALEQEGCTLIPRSVYLSDNNKVKVEVVLGKGKKNYDKRESLKKKTQERDMKREAGSY